MSLYKYFKRVDKIAKEDQVESVGSPKVLAEKQGIKRGEYKKLCHTFRKPCMREVLYTRNFLTALKPQNFYTAKISTLTVFCLVKTLYSKEANFGNVHR